MSHAHSSTKPHDASHAPRHERRGGTGGTTDGAHVRRGSFRAGRRPAGLPAPEIPPVLAHFSEVRMPEPTISGRALATALGVSEKAVRKAVEAGRIKREADGRFDLMACRSGWNRTTDPARSKVRTSTDLAAGPQSAPSKVRTSAAPLPQADLGTLWSIVAGLPALAAWGTALNGGGLQLAYDIAADMALDVGGDLRIRGFAPLPIDFEAIDWTGLAEEAGLALIDPAAMAADWQRRRDGN